MHLCIDQLTSAQWIIGYRWRPRIDSLHLPHLVEIQLHFLALHLEENLRQVKDKFSLESKGNFRESIHRLSSQMTFVFPRQRFPKLEGMLEVWILENNLLPSGF